MYAPAPSYRWYYDVHVNGTSYPLRNRLEIAPADGVLNARAFRFTPEQVRTGTAIHVLGHALVWMHQGIHVRRIEIKQRLGHLVDGAAVAGPVRDTSRMLGWVLGLVAGERAVDRWLREEALWTPSRAAWAEMSAKHDRDLVLDSPIDPKPGFGTGSADYGDLHELADQALVQVWERLRNALPVLLLREALSGDEVAGMSSMTNPSKRVPSPRSRAGTARPAPQSDCRTAQLREAGPPVR